MKFEAVEGRLAENLPGYQARPSQQRLAAAIETALESQKGLLANGPVGIGKSLAGMIPSISYAVDHHTRVVIATSTIALMEQYANIDIPFLEKHSGLKFTWAMIKGKGRYVCASSLNDAESSAKIERIQDLRKELDDPNHDGDFEHVETPLTDTDRLLLTTTADDCPGVRECVFGSVCFAEKAKDKALQSDVVITNTAMLTADLELRESTGGGVNVLGEYDAVLVDEGHLLEQTTSNSLGTQISQRGVEATLSRAYNFLRSQGGRDYEESMSAARNALADISGLLLDSDDTTELNKTWFIMNSDPFIALVQAMQKIGARVKATSVDDDKSATKQKIIARQYKNMTQKIPKIILSEDYDLVRWLETKLVGKADKRQTVWALKTAPVDVSEFLREWLFQRVPTILMSGTLAVKDRKGNDDFSFIQRSTGSEAVPTIAVESPFNYQQQQLIWAPPESAPSPKSYYPWLGWSQGIMLELIDAAPDKGALLLFTSKKDMEAAFLNLEERLEDRGRLALMQYHKHSNKELAAFFKEATTSVLFGLASFGTGFDVQGDALGTVVISKLPFPVPVDPIFKAKSLREENAGRKPFGSLSMPMTAMTLEQFSGRAVRTVSDRGVVAILDQRVTSTAWGKQLLSAIPGRQTTSLQEVRDFWSESDTEEEIPF